MKKFYRVLLLLFILNNFLFAQYSFVGEVKSFQKFDNRVEFELTNAKFNLYIYSSDVIRFRYTNQKEFSKAPSYAVVASQPEMTQFNFTDMKDHFALETKDLIIIIHKAPTRVRIFDKNKNLINCDDESFGVSFNNDEVKCFKKLLPGENFYGLGEKSDDLRKNGNQYEMWNTDFPAYTRKKDALYVSIPFFMGIKDFKAYGIFFDNTYKSHFNMGASNDRFYWFGADAGEMDYYFIYGPEIKNVISNYTKLTGRMELPPKWSLGYQQSRWSYYPESEVRDIAENFRERGIPCDVIYLDIHYMDGYRVFTWDKERFPQPEEMLSDLARDGFKIIPIIDPGVKADTNYFAAKDGLKKNVFAKYPDGEFYKGEVWPSWAYFPDFTKKITRDWWGEKLSALMKQGVAGFWNDMNEPAVWGQSFPDIVQFDDNGFGADHRKIHNVFGLEMAHATRDAINKYSDQRKFILTRAAFAGVQRYAAVWTGDNEATDEHLMLSCTMAQNMGLSGLSFVGPDAGGFIGDPTPRMYVRWMELGAFTPFFRGHSEIGARAKEPWAFNEFTERQVKELIQLRYRMIPFWYNEFYNSTLTGLPVLRAMYLNFQKDENCYSRDAQFQFMLGENILVAPVLNQYDDFKKFYLPEGKWYDMTNEEVVDGGKWIVKEAPIDRLLWFLREGGIIPMQESMNYIGEKEVDQIELTVFPSISSKFSLYEDDGTSFKYKSGEFSFTEFDLIEDKNSLGIKIFKSTADYKTVNRSYVLKILAQEKPGKITVNDREISETKFDDLKNSAECYFYDQIKKIIFIKTPESVRMDVRIGTL
ncbi:MAG: glycoside hydrolase family 31 protein [bacterium]